MESKLNGQMDSHSNYSAHVWVVQNFDSFQNIVVKDDFDLHYFQFKINILIFSIVYILNSRSSLVTVLHTSD